MKRSNSAHDIIELLISKLFIVLPSMILFGAAFFLIAKFFIPYQYESYTSMYVKNSNEKTISDNVNINDLNASKSLVETYIEVLSSNAVLNKVGEHLVSSTDLDVLSTQFNVKDGNISTQAIRSCFTMKASNQTEVLKITARTKDPEISAKMCNIVGETAPEFLSRIVGAGSVEVIDTAVPNASPVSPNIPFITLVGVVVGLVVSFGSVYLLERLDNTVTDKDYIADMFQKPILGTIQHIFVEDDDAKTGKKKKAKYKKGDSRQLILNEKVPFNYVESYKSIRTNVLFSLGTVNGKVIAVTSSSPDEGKSTVAVNLAMAMAQSGKKVLIIDADLRKPVLHRMFKTENKSGLSTAIIDVTPFASCVKANVIPNLDLLTSGPTPPNPSELLATPNMRKIIKQIEGSYDYIIIDTPPINVVSDCMVLTDIVSGVLVVLRYKKTTYHDVSEVMNTINLANANMLGFVINDVKPNELRSYYRGYYSYKYGYGSYGGYGYGNNTNGSNSNN